MSPHPRLTLRLLADRLAVCRLPAEAGLPAPLARRLADPPRPVTGEAAAPFLLSCTRTADELSLVLPALEAELLMAELLMADRHVEGGWRALMVVGPLDFTLVGILAELAGRLAAAGVAIFVLSTFDTDYLLVKQESLEAAVAALEAAGHTVDTGPG